MAKSMWTLQTSMCCSTPWCEIHAPPQHFDQRLTQDFFFLNHKKEKLFVDFHIKTEKGTKPEEHYRPKLLNK